MSVIERLFKPTVWVNPSVMERLFKPTVWVNVSVMERLFKPTVWGKCVRYKISAIGFFPE